MFEINKKDAKEFRNMKLKGAAGTVYFYDFTLMGRYVVFHCKADIFVAYKMFDKVAGRQHGVLNSRILFTEKNYTLLVPFIMYAVREELGHPWNIRFKETVNMADHVELLFRNIMPQIGNNFIINVKDTSVMFIIGFSDFFAVHKMVSGAVFKYFPSAFMEMAGYLCMTLLASFLLRRFEKKLAGKSNYELVNADQLVLTAGTYSYPGEGSPFDEISKDYKGEAK